MQPRKCVRPWPYNSAEIGDSDYAIERRLPFPFHPNGVGLMRAPRGIAHIDPSWMGMPSPEATSCPLPPLQIPTARAQLAAGSSEGIRSKTLTPGGMTAQGGRLRAKMAIIGRNAEGSSRVPA